MAQRAAIRWLVWVSCWAVVLLGARKAHAYAPMCDERGMSISAPAPVMPMGDASIEGASPLGCDGKAGVARVGVRARSQSVVDPSPLDPCVRVELVRAVRVASIPFVAPRAAAVALPPGHARGVFRPPRG